MRIPDADHAAALVMGLDMAERRLLLRALVEDYSGSPTVASVAEWKADLETLKEAFVAMTRIDTLLKIQQRELKGKQ